MKKLDQPQGIWNIDNMENRLGKITHSTTLSVTTKQQNRDMTFLVTDIGNKDVLLGYPWLATYEPTISWRHATIKESMLPIIIHTINPRRILSKEAWKMIVAELKEDINDLPTSSKELRQPS